MKFPLSWVGEYVDLSDVTADALAASLTSAGFEVEECISVGAGLTNIITGRIDLIEKHPDADRLQIAQIFDGVTHHQIVTGAQNITVGDIVPVSLPGAVLAGGLKIKPSKLRGIPSNGMLCSETELGITDRSEGIWILDPATPIGVDFVEYGLLTDSVLEISILPNRGDCQSMLGLARELSVILERPTTLPPIYAPPEGPSPVEVVVEDKSICPSYRCVGVKDVKNGVAPLVMRRRLALAGIRSIDLIVDVTNYVLLETGQPLHAFDHDQLSGNVIRVGYSKLGEMCQTLDDEVRELSGEFPVIRDAHGIVAVAGVIGAKSSAVHSRTQSLLIEAAYFSPTPVRRSRASLGIRTESSIRFEKGVDPEGVSFGLYRALYLLNSLTPGCQISGEAASVDFDHPINHSSGIELMPKKINRLLGTAYDEDTMATILTRLGFKIDKGFAMIPSWRRHDIKDWPCLAEEIARIAGYGAIPESHDFRMVPREKSPRMAEMATKTVDFFVYQGFQQVQTFTMVSSDDFKSTKVPLPSEWLQIQNPLTPSESVLRRYLMPSLLRVVAHNLKRQQTDLQLFEVGKVFYLAEHGVIKEHLVSGAICTGDRLLHPYTSSQKASSEYTYHDIKGMAEELLSHLGIDAISYKPTQYPQYHPNMSADIYVAGALKGNIGFLHPDVLENYDIKQPVIYFGLNLSGLEGELITPSEFQPFGRYPNIRRDIALLAPKSLGYRAIDDAIKRILPATVAQYYLFDYFESEKIGAENMSLAFSFVYQDMERTLSDEEVSNAHATFCENLTDALPISIR